MTGTNTLAPEPVKVPELHHDDIIHIAPHEVFRHTEFIHLVRCAEADVQVDCLIRVETVVVICWQHCTCPGVCGAVVYDADDYVERKAVAA